MHLRHLPMILLTLFLAACAHPSLQVNSGSRADIEIVQRGSAAAIDAGGALRLRGEPFEIRSRWPQVHVCISRSREDLGTIAAGVDTLRDAGSCFNIARSYAMEGDADYLVLGDGASALNDAHGMRHGNRDYWYRVRFLFDERSQENIPLTRLNAEYFSAFWIDKSNDRRLDAGEFVLVPLKFGDSGRQGNTP